ncbi:hypothetical protein BJ165DRAFT_1403476 [Panaeolus papilionaceus]|nr:hypothetical protein BJ165DRAFT_1403476 [Panaeolus papilionaceus]
MGPTGPLPVTLPPNILSSSPGVGTPSSTTDPGGPPFSFGSSSLSTGGAGALALSTTKPKITNPGDIPAAQEFSARVVPGGTSGTNEMFESICGMDEYAFFSLEEMRCYAYMRGQKLAPPGIKMDPFVVPKKEGSSGTPVPGSNETLECITANALYDKHSTEELRIAYLLSHREMTSAELLPGVPSVLPPITTNLIPPATPLQLGNPTSTTPLQLGVPPITPLQIGAAPGVGSLIPATPLALGAPQANTSLFGTPATTTPSTAPRFSFNFR